ncbi:endolytic transglycosylase MltG [Kordia algicida OT-1]|uniref:Putative aminodeoxychorismate lyase n=1 Tax=Kordia algicida OT-1 TaxID=391587 RepID=A9DYW3_9FLAO|nr:endolytic transglycosylase MltG [Kordia algicida]EDP96188.1 putative aminodeoxychorismate lyase [Kordia algicida OT-1]
MSYVKKILIGILILGVLVGFYLMYNITQTIFKPITAFNNEEAYIYIPSDADFLYVRKEIKPLLSEEKPFVTLAKKKGYIKRVKGGKYTIKKDMNSNEIVKTLMGRSDDVAVFIPKNNTIETIAKQVSNQIEASEADLKMVLLDTVFLQKKQLSFSALYVSGTYRMPWNTSAEEFRTIIFDRYQKQKLKE